MGLFFFFFPFNQKEKKMSYLKEIKFIVNRIADFDAYTAVGSRSLREVGQ